MTQMPDQVVPFPGGEQPAAVHLGFRERSYRGPALRASAWIFAGQSANGLLRLASNLILTRLLVPEIFGVMVVINVFLQLCETFSDVGIAPSIIQDRRGDDLRFLDTAFTVQVIRGVLLWGAAIALAYPCSLIYNNPLLLTILPIVGIRAAILGLSNTNVHTLNRHLRIGRVTILDLCGQLTGIAVGIAWAVVDRTIWALVAADLVNTTVRAVGSHFLDPSHRNHLAWEKAAVASLFRFGRWVFLATLLGFIASRADRLILGRMLTAAELGVYWIALQTATVAVKLVTKYTRRVLLPLYARLSLHCEARFRSSLFRVRAALLAVTLPPLCLLIIFGPQVIELLYDPRYVAAGWMLRYLAAGAIFTIISTTVQPVLLANGDSYRHMLLTLTQAVLLLSGMAVGGYLGGTHGLIAAAACSTFLSYPALAWAVNKYGAWQPLLDFTALGLCAVAIATGLWMLH